MAVFTTAISFKKTLLSEIFAMQFNKCNGTFFPANQISALSLFSLFLRDDIKNIVQCFIIYVAILSRVQNIYEMLPRP